VTASLRLISRKCDVRACTFAAALELVSDGQPLNVFCERHAVEALVAFVESERMTRDATPAETERG
jgi:hypothetical protein